MVRLLPAGRAAIEKAAPRQFADVRRNFIDLLTPAELDMLAALNERVLRHLAETALSPPKMKPHGCKSPRFGSRRIDLADRVYSA